MVCYFRRKTRQIVVVVHAADHNSLPAVLSDDQPAPPHVAERVPIAAQNVHEPIKAVGLAGVDFPQRLLDGNNRLFALAGASSPSGSGLCGHVVSQSFVGRSFVASQRWRY